MNKAMSSLKIAASVMVVTSLLGWLVARRAAESDRPSPESSADGSELTSALFSAKPAYVSESFVRHYDWGLYGNNRKLVFKDESLAAGTWNENVFKFSASFDILDVCSVSKDAYYLLGEDLRNGVLVQVIEAWQVVPAESPLGGPPAYQVDRNQLYRDVSLGSMLLIGADPDHRFIMVTRTSSSGNGVDIVQLSLPTLTPTVLYANTYDFDAMGVFQHAVEGRVWILHTNGMDWVAMLHDQDNDGVFDAKYIVNNATWHALDLESGFIDNFVFH